MKPVLALCLCVAVNLVLHAQNLVPNGSFEEYTECPDSNFFGQWQLVVDWTSPYTPSADYYNRCAGGVVCSVPFNTCGYQEPADGDAYMGIATFANGGFPLYRETIGCQLTEPLIPGVQVYVSYKVSAGGWGSWDGGSAQFAAKGPGMNFFTAYPADWSSYFFPNAATVDMTAVLSDTSMWTLVLGTFIPDSAYEYLLIGNFFEDSLSLVVVQDTVFGTLPGAYAFVDEVCISQNPAYCSGWNGVPEWADGPCRVSARQNPFSDEFELIASQAPSTPWRVDAMDATGRRVGELFWPAGSQMMRARAEELPIGMIALVFSGEGCIPKPLKLVHVSH